MQEKLVEFELLYSERKNSLILYTNDSFVKFCGDLKKSNMPILKVFSTAWLCGILVLCCLSNLFDENQNLDRAF